MERKLNLDIAGSVSELETLLKRVFPRNILYKLVAGRGLEFDGYREYTPADDAVNIDWKASARSQKILIKEYIEERDLKFVFLIDVSENMVFGSTEKLKCEYCAELCSALSHLMLVSGDRVGFILFNENIVSVVMPNLGKKQFDILVHELSNPLNYGGNSALNEVLDTAIEIIDASTSLVFLVSDFIKVDESYKKNLETLGGLFETIAILIRDPLDISLPHLNREVVIQNSEGGQKLLINPKVAKASYEKNALEQLNFVKQLFRDQHIDFLELSTETPFSEGLSRFFMERIKTGRKAKTKNVY